MKRLLKKMLRRPVRLLVNAGILPDVIILKCDGGICSQMHFRLVGELLERRGQRVLYNIDWFETDGKDLDGRFCRNFDLLRMFHALRFPISKNRLLDRLYHFLFYHRNDYYDNDHPFGWLELQGPLWLDGYFKDPEEMFGEVFDDLFQVDLSVLDEPNRQLLERIEKAEDHAGACAMHVRRGDLARYNAAYGEPTTVEYFLENADRLRRENPGVQFFIFSDEPAWCRENLLPLLGDGDDVTICDINGSDKGYCDLILMSRCRHIIASQGSMGRYAMLLRKADKHLREADKQD